MLFIITKRKGSQSALVILNVLKYFAQRTVAYFPYLELSGKVSD